MDPRQKLCWESYANPNSSTFGNALQSALKAGYEQTYAEQITGRPWFTEKVTRLNMLGKAEKVLDQTLDMSVTVDGATDRGLLSIQTDVAKFIAETQGKSHGYSKRQELTGADGDAMGPFLFTWTKEDDSKNDSDPVHSPVLGEDVSQGGDQEEVSGAVNSSTRREDNSILQPPDQASIDGSAPTSPGETA